MDRKQYALLVVLALLALPLFKCHAYADLLTFEKVYEYQASEADSKLSCRTIVLEQVKRLLLEELGTYLESVTEVKNFQITKDQITLLAAGVVQTKIVNEKWDGKQYSLKARLTADPDQVAKSIDTLRKDRRKVKELEKIKQQADRALREVENLKSELASVKRDDSKQKIKEYYNSIKKLEAYSKTNVATLEAGRHEIVLSRGEQTSWLLIPGSMTYSVYCQYGEGDFTLSYSDGDVVYFRDGENKPLPRKTLATFKILSLGEKQHFRIIVRQQRDDEKLR